MGLVWRVCLGQTASDLFQLWGFLCASRIRGIFDFLQTSPEPCAIRPFGFHARMRKWTKRKKAALLANNFLCSPFLLEVSDGHGPRGSHFKGCSHCAQVAKGFASSGEGRDCIGWAVELDLKRYDHLYWENVNNRANTLAPYVGPGLFLEPWDRFKHKTYTSTPPVTTRNDFVVPLLGPKEPWCPSPGGQEGRQPVQRHDGVCRRQDQFGRGLGSLSETGLVNARVDPGLGAPTKRLGGQGQLRSSASELWGARALGPRVALEGGCPPSKEGSLACVTAALWPPADGSWLPLGLSSKPGQRRAVSWFLLFHLAELTLSKCNEEPCYLVC